MSAEGKVMIDLPAGPGTAVGVRFLPPADVTRLLVGKMPEEVLKIVPAVHGVCATAQTHAAVLALEGACGISSAARTLAARQALTMMECLREHLLRTVMDWPKLMGLTGDLETARRAMTLLPRFQSRFSGENGPFGLGSEVAVDTKQLSLLLEEVSAMLKRAVFGEDPRLWLSRQGGQELRSWSKTSETGAGRFLAWLFETGRFGIAAISPPASGAGFSEATSLVRRIEDPLLASLGAPALGNRFVARLVELARLPDEIRAVLEGDMASPGPVRVGGGQGRGRVEAARGPLIHNARLEAGRVSAYDMEPPTNCNFAENGVAMRCLKEIAVLDRAERALCAHLVVNAVDPCVAYEVRAA